MRHLHTIVCATAVLVFGSGCGVAQEVDGLAAADADQFNNAYFLEQSARDQRLWLGAFMAGTTSTLGMQNPEAGQCVARWYYEGEDEAFASILAAVARFPENRPVEVIFALARRECGELTAAG